jgi:hypothetical protein
VPEPEVDDSTLHPPVVFTTATSAGEKKINGNGNEENSGQWSSVPVAPDVPSSSSLDQTHPDPTHPLSKLRRVPSHPKSENSTHHSNHLLQQQHQRTKLLQQQQQSQETKPCVYSITVDYGASDDSDSESSPLPDTLPPSTWMGAMGMLFWPSNEIKSDPHVVRSGPYEGCPTGSYGYLMHQISNDGMTMCPPERGAWESLLISKAQEVAMDAIIDQILSLASGLIDSLEVSHIRVILFDFLNAFSIGS